MARMTLSCSGNRRRYSSAFGSSPARRRSSPSTAHQLLEQCRPLLLRHLDEELLDPRPFPGPPGALEPLGRRVDPAPIRRRDLRHINLAIVNDRGRTLTHLAHSRPQSGDIHVVPGRLPRAGERWLPTSPDVIVLSVDQDSDRLPDTRRRLLRAIPGIVLPPERGPCRRRFPGLNASIAMKKGNRPVP